MGLEIIGAGLNYKASKKAANAQQEGAAQASAVAKDTADKQLALQREIWEKQQADYKPYLEQGTWGINRLGDLMRNQYQAPMSNEALAFVKNKRNVGRLTEPVNNANGGQLNNPFDTYLASKGLAGGQFDTSNPAYQFQLKQGQQALDRSSAARGMGYSGAQMKASQEYGQGLASQQYDKEYNRASGEFGDYFNRLAGLSQGGQQAANTLGSYGNQYANAGSNTLGSLGGSLQNNLGQAANARASGYIGGANAINGGIQNMTDNAFRLASLFKPLGGFGSGGK